jgi:hypothetical protein
MILSVAQFKSLRVSLKPDQAEKSGACTVAVDVRLRFEVSFVYHYFRLPRHVPVPNTEIFIYLVHLFITNASPMSSPSAWRIIVAAAVVQLLLNCGSHISLAPQTAILQEIICEKYYQTHALDPDLLDRCKVEPVQSEVAYIDGWRATFETLPGTLNKPSSSVSFLYN